MSGRRGRASLLQLRNIGHAVIDEMDGDGQVTKVCLRRRISNPFETLHMAGRLDGEERAAVYVLVGLHARSRGLAGRPDDDLGTRIDCVSDPHLEKLRMAKNGVAFGEVMARLDPWPALVLRGLIADLVEGDGARPEGDGVRWRGIVRALAMDWNRRLKAARVAGNAADIDGGHRIDVRESEAGRVVARAILMAATQGADTVPLSEVLIQVRAWTKKHRPDMARYFYA